MADSELRLIAALLHAPKNEQAEFYTKQIPKGVFTIREDEIRWVYEFRQKYGKYPSPTAFFHKFKERLRVPDDPLPAVLQPILDRAMYDQMVRVQEQTKEELDTGAPLSAVMARWKEGAARVTEFSYEYTDVNLETSEGASIGYKEKVKARQGGSTLFVSPWPTLNKLVSFFLPKEVYTLVARSSMGKAQPLSSLVMTPEGFIQMGDIEIGSKVIGSNGKATTVLGVYPQGVKRVYKVIFSDNTSVRCCGEHLWLTKTHNERRYKQKGSVKTTDEIRNSIRHTNGKFNHSVPTVSPIELKQTNLVLPLHPWLLGALLGDGGITRQDVSFTNEEWDVHQKFASLLPVYDKATFADDITVTLSRKKRNNCRTQTAYCLDRLKLLGHTGKTKFVPRCYKYGSIEERIELLRGLFDTDGSVVGNGTMIDYSTVSRQLALDVAWIARSLGAIVRETEKIARCVYLGEDYAVKAYRLYIRFLSEIVPISSLKNKAKWRKANRKTSKKIVAIIPDGKEICQCIKIDSFDSLYVTEGFNLTHNTWFALWIGHFFASLGIKVLLISKEMGTEVLEDRVTCIRFNLPYGLFRSGELPPKLLRKWRREKRQFKKSGKTYPFILSGNETFEGVGFSYIQSQIDKYKPQVVIVDGAYLLYPEGLPKNANDVQRFTLISNRSKSLAKSNKVFWINVIQHGRKAENEKGETKGGATTIFGSDSWYQSSDWVHSIGGTRGTDFREHELIKGRESGLCSFPTKFSFYPHPDFSEIKGVVKVTDVVGMVSFKGIG